MPGTDVPRGARPAAGAQPQRQQRHRRRAGPQRACAQAAEEAGPTTSFFSPSKINLFLRIVRKREDGYHDLASLFHVIDLGDGLDFTPLSPAARADELHCKAPGVPRDGSNLVIRALDTFRQHTGSQQHYRIRLRKRVPHGAGLGGGSGNAATAFWAANALTGAGATDRQLMAWGGEIGSDISIFFAHGAAYGTGRGEQVEEVALESVPLSTPLLLVKPPAGLSTGAIFRALDLSRTSPADPRQLLEQVQREGLRPQTTINDLEAPAFATLPSLGALKGQLREEGEGFSDVFMTGSGSTLVCVGADSRPPFLNGPEHRNTFVSPARLIRRRPGQWYEAPGPAPP